MGSLTVVFLLLGCSSLLFHCVASEVVQKPKRVLESSEESSEVFKPKQKKIVIPLRPGGNNPADYDGPIKQHKKIVIPSRPGGNNPADYDRSIKQHKEIVITFPGGGGNNRANYDGSIKQFPGAKENNFRFNDPFYKPMIGKITFPQEGGNKFGYGGKHIKLGTQDLKFILSEISKMLPLPRVSLIVLASKKQSRNGSAKYIVGYIATREERNFCKAWVTFYRDEEGNIIHTKTKYGRL
uniref:Plexin-B3 n=1 Tax=Lygus hesperus TaxID=30085 RepID=A0A0A9WZV2_LYGHE